MNKSYVFFSCEASLGSRPPPLLNMRYGRVMRILITEVEAEVTVDDVSIDGNTGGADFFNEVASITPGRKTLMEKVRI